MAMKGGNPKNLKRSTPEEARKNGAKGGKKSGEVRKERKLLSQAYAEIIAKLSSDKGLKGLTLEDVLLVILSKGDSAAVAALKELGERTEGNKVVQDINITGNTKVAFDFVEPPEKPE